MKAAYVLTVSEKPTASNIKSGDSLSDSSLSGGVVKNRGGQTISDWAVAAIQWACGAGLINGRTESTIVPDGTATRAEAAAIMQRFSEQR